MQELIDELVDFLRGAVAQKAPDALLVDLLLARALRGAAGLSAKLNARFRQQMLLRAEIPIG
ncbi:hypothetical protein SDC9_158297 [bioreactor metagenome]|uniref:Uncharacterized protein n=1 Tax=bioreactor metagenome TaxID=1076179 RepID=A0A645FCD0_9ZZZZ